MTVKHNARVKYDPDETTMLLQGINCTVLGADEQVHSVNGVDVTFQFTISKAFFSSSYINALKRDLC
jgi:hypothetical protein